MYTASLFIDLPELELRGVEDARPTPRLHWRIRSRLERWNARSFLRATLASPIFGSSASHSLILRNSPHRRPIDRFCFFLPSFLSLFSPPPFDFFPLCLSPSSAFGQKFIIFSFSSFHPPSLFSSAFLSNLVLATSLRIVRLFPIFSRLIGGIRTRLTKIDSIGERYT